MVTYQDSTFDITKFKPTKHFEERALERFGITAMQMTKFLKDNTPTNNVQLAAYNNRIQTISKNGIMFVLNPDSKEIITTYKSISPKIAESKQKAFQNELNNMIGRYQMITAQSYLSEIAENINRFSELSQDVLNKKPSQLNFAIIEQIYKDMTVIKTTLNLLSKQNDYYQNHSDSYNPFKELNFKPLDDHFDEPKLFNLDKPEKPIVQQTELESNKTNINPTDYTPKISNKEILQGEKPLKDILTPAQKQQVNNWITKTGKNKLAGQVMKSIKQKVTKTQLLKSIKPQLKLVEYNNFSNLITKMIKENK